jgi:hypothetical protein
MLISIFYIIGLLSIGTGIINRDTLSLVCGVVFMLASCLLVWERLNE